MSAILFRPFRAFRTTPEVRAIPAALEQGVPVRAKRGAKQLPNAWDDRPCGRRGRCDRYKNHR